MHTELYKLDEADRQGLETVVNAWEQQYRDPRRAWELLQTLPAMACLAPAVRAAASFQMALAALRTLPAERADPLLEQAQAWARDSGHGLAVWRVEVASAMRKILRGQAEVAVDGLQRLAEHTPGEASASDRWLVLNQLSIGLAMAADLDRALPVYYRALDAARDCALPMLVATTGCNLGGYQTDLHNPEEALPLLEEALGIAVQQASDRLVAFIAPGLVECLGALGRHEDALGVAQQFLQEERFLRYADPTAVHCTLALAWLNAGRLSEAGQALQAAWSALESEAGGPAGARFSSSLWEFAASIQALWLVRQGRLPEADRFCESVLGEPGWGGESATRATGSASFRRPHWRRRPRATSGVRWPGNGSTGGCSNA